MKQVAHISLSLILMVSIIGVTVSKHYCGDILKGTSVVTDAESCNDMEELPMGCCHNESQHFEIKDQYEITNYVFNQNLLPVNLFFYGNLIQSFSKEVHKIATHYYEPPSPPLLGQDIYIQVQSFLI